jgi:hypothetical protein
MSQFLGNMSTPNVLFDVARGNLEGASAVNLFGFNKLVGSEFEIIWNDGGQYIYPVAAVAMTVTTDNVDDYGKQVQIQGLDANYDMLSEIVTLADGGVVTNSLFFRINLAIMVTDENIGNVSITNNSIKYGYIESLIGITQACLYTVPRNHSLYLFRIDANSATANQNSYITIRNVTCSSAGLKLRVAEATFATSQVSYDRQVPFKLPEKTDFSFEAKSSHSTNEVAVFVEAVLVRTS